MKDAIAAVDFFTSSDDGEVKRLSLVIAAPKRIADGTRWHCRVALADIIRPKSIEGRDSVEALCRAMSEVRGWILELDRQGRVLTRDRAGEIPFELP